MSIGTGNDLERKRAEMSSIEAVRGAILRSCAGMNRMVADLNHTDAESLNRRIHDVELVTEAAKTEDQMAAARLSFHVVWDALRSTPAGDGDVILNRARCEKYLLESSPD